MYGTPYSSAPFGAMPAATFPSAGAFERILFLSPEDSDDATITAAGTALMPVANLQDRQPGKVWRSEATRDRLLIRCNRPMAANRFAFCNAGFSAACWARPRAFRNDADLVADTNAAFDAGWMRVWPDTGKGYRRDWECWLASRAWTNNASFLFWSLDLDDIVPLEAGRLMLGRGLSPGRNMDWGHEFGMVSSDVSARSEWGTDFGDPRRQARTCALRFSAVAHREAFDLFHELQRRRGTARDLVVLTDPAATADFQSFSLHVRIETMGKLASVAAWDGTDHVWSFSLGLTEQLD